MKFNSFLYTGLGFALYYLSHQMEMRGDAYPMTEAVSRLQFHLMALAALLGALGCFAYSLINLYRNRRY